MMSRRAKLLLMFHLFLHVSSVCAFNYLSSVLPRHRGRSHINLRACLKQSSSDVGPVDRRSEEVQELEELVKAGRLKVWKKGEAPPEALAGGGARGAGHSKDTFNSHVEPDTIYVVGTSHISQESAKLVEKVVSTLFCNSAASMPCQQLPSITYSSLSCIKYTRTCICTFSFLTTR
jgi:hypothetical protein